MSDLAIDNIIEACRIKQEMWRKSAEAEQKKNKSQNSLFEEKNEFSVVKGTQCPVCLTSMTTDGKKPITISPCGHTVCSSCLKEKDKYCPVCRNLISQRAVNYSLLQIAETFNDNGNFTPDYKKELESVQDQISELLVKLEDNKQTRKDMQEQERVAKAVIEHLENEMHKLGIKEKILKEKLDEAQKETNKAEDEFNGLKEVIENLKITSKKQELEELLQK